MNPFILFGLALQAAPLWVWLVLWALFLAGVGAVFLSLVRWRMR